MSPVRQTAIGLTLALLIVGGWLTLHVWGVFFQSLSWPAVAVAPLLILAQSWFVLDRIRATVEAAGGRMDDVFKLVQYFRNLDHFPHYSRVRKHFFPGEPPASTVVEVSAMLPTPDILVEVEATAYVPLPRP